MNFQPLRDFLDSYIPMLGIPGSDTVIYKNHEVVFRHSSGYDSVNLKTPVRRNALYNIYSCTKVSAAVAATQLIERGEILVTDPVYAYIPEFADITVKHVNSDGSVDIRPAQNTMLIKHLLTMTSGLDYNLCSPSILEVQERTGGRCPTLETVRAMAKEPLSFEPGEDYQYSLSLDVIGAIIEVVSGMKLGEYMKQNIFDPLGMKETGFVHTDDVLKRMACQYQYDTVNRVAVEIPKDRNPYKLGTEFESIGAGIISSVDDYGLLADALACGGVGKNGNRILSEAGIRLMTRNNLSEPLRKKYADKQRMGYGYGYGVRTNMYPEEAGNLAPIGHFGWDGAKHSLIEMDPVSKVGVFHAEHMGGLASLVIPRLRNLVFSCLEKD